MVILDQWSYVAKSQGQGMVFPDGCRDLIMHHTKGCKPRWFVSSLDHVAKTVQRQRGEQFIGYRLYPGAIINEYNLLKSIQGMDDSQIDVTSLINENVSIDSFIEKALVVLSQCRSINHAAKKLGVSTRSLQRLFLQHTNTSPQFWLSLSRARKACENLKSSQSFSDIAIENGYSDQAHLCREFKRLLLYTPGQLRKSAKKLDLVTMSGFS